MNDLCTCESAAYLAKYDSVHGTWSKTPQAAEDGESFVVDGKKVTFSQEKNFTQVDFAGMGVELVAECTGQFLKAEELQPYFDTCKVKQVVVSAPVKGEGATNIVLGCNHAKLVGRPLVTNASCTTNSLAPVVKVVHERFGIEKGCITTIHNVTATQSLVDMPNNKKSDLRRARSGMANLCPTEHGQCDGHCRDLPRPSKGRSMAWLSVCRC